MTVSERAKQVAALSKEARFFLCSQVERFLKTIGRGTDELAPKFATWDELVQSDGAGLKKKGVAVRKRRWILNWVEKYRQGVDPYHIPLMSRAKKNKFISRKKPKTKEEKRRKD
jgi:hypothetical protein